MRVYGGTFANAEGHGDDPIDARHAVEAADKVGEVIEDAEVVLNHNDVAEKDGKMRRWNGEKYDGN